MLFSQRLDKLEKFSLVFVLLFFLHSDRLFTFVSPWCLHTVVFFFVFVSSLYFCFTLMFAYCWVFLFIRIVSLSSFYLCWCIRTVSLPLFCLGSCTFDVIVLRSGVIIISQEKMKGIHYYFCQIVEMTIY